MNRQTKKKEGTPEKTTERPLIEEGDGNLLKKRHTGTRLEKNIPVVGNTKPGMKVLEFYGINGGNFWDRGL